MKISLGMNLRSGPWGGGNQFGSALVKGLAARGVTVTYDLTDPDLDLIFLADPRIELQITAYNHFDILHYLRHVNPRALVVYRVSDSDKRKGGGRFDALARQAVQVVDDVLWATRWLRDEHISQGMNPVHETAIFNGVDENIFHARGYQRWDHQEPLKLVTHHWGGLWSKGFDIYQRLDQLLISEKYRDRIAFTYIGNVPDGFEFHNATYIEPTSGHALADLLRSHHVYVTGAQHEPGGNHHMEGAGCGLPVLYRESGGVPEYCRGFGIGFEGLDDFEARLDQMLVEYDQWANQMPGYPYNHEHMVQYLYEHFEAMLADRDAILARRRWTHQLPDVRGDASQGLNWLHQIRDAIRGYVDSLQVDDQVGRYLPAHEAVTEVGRTIALPLSLWALRIYDLLKVEPLDLSAWLDVIQGFQVEGNPYHVAAGQNAFVDPLIADRVRFQTRRLIRWKTRLLPNQPLTALDVAISAETRQAITTLATFDRTSRNPYRGFPQTVGRLRGILKHLNQSQRAHYLADVAVFYRIEAPRFLAESQIDALQVACREAIGALQDTATGLYGGDVRDTMQAIMALEQLDTPIHQPELLIDTLLRQPSPPDAETLLAIVYSLHRCGGQSDHRRAEIQTYAADLIPILQMHFNPLDGGFMRTVAPQEQFLYGLRLHRERPISDLYGTLLLTWAGGVIEALVE